MTRANADTLSFSVANAEKWPGKRGYNDTLLASKCGFNLVDLPPSCPYHWLYWSVWVGFLKTVILVLPPLGGCRLKHVLSKIEIQRGHK